MQIEQVVILSILGLIAICTSVLVAKRNKNEGGTNVNILLLEYMDDIIKLSKGALLVLETQRDNFNSDREFYDTLSNIVMRDIRQFLLEKADIDPRIMDLLTEDNLSEIVYVVIYQLKKYLHDRDTMEEVTEDEIYPIIEEQTPSKEDQSTVNIISELNNIIEDENDPEWNSDDYI